jgi:hypothetical protein
MRLVACLHTDFDMEIQHSRLKINHLSNTPSTKADGAVPSTKAVGGGISVVCLTRTSRYRSKRRSWLVPLLPTQGPMPIADRVGMGVAVSILFNSLTATPCLKGETHIQFDSMRRPRATYTLAWESSPKGIQEGTTISMGMTKATMTLCPIQQKWFNLMLRGAENQMGCTTQRQQPLSMATIIRLLALVKEEAEEQEHQVAREFFKVGAAIALAMCGSLQGNEVFMLDLNGLRKHINLGKGGTLPKDPMKAGTDLSQAPHIIIPLLSEFKGELGYKYHQMALASTTSSGIELRWWMEKLIQVRQEENCTTGPGFGHKD